jgi:hypothetical protein
LETKLDPRSKSRVHSYYVPCTIAYPDCAFFEVFPLEPVQDEPKFLRYAIKPQEYLKTALPGDIKEKELISGTFQLRAYSVKTATFALRCHCQFVAPHICGYRPELLRQRSQVQARVLGCA